MQSKPPVVDYRGADALPPREPPRPWMKKSAGEVAARISGFGLCCLGGAAVLLPIGPWVGILVLILFPILFVLAGLAFFLGSIISVIGVFEAPEVRSHVGLGCSMALALLFGFVALWVLGLLLFGLGSLGGH
jgi:hypothetical protein